MLETFNVLRIDEPDFGCEGRPDGMEVKDNVLLKSNYTGEEMTCLLYTSDAADDL